MGQSSLAVRHPVSAARPPTVRRLPISRQVPGMDWFYGLSQPFRWHPERSLLVALAWVLLAVGLGRRGRQLLFAVAGAWALFAGIELYFVWHVTDMRVDVVLTWPVLCLLTIGCGLRWLRLRRASAA